MNAREKLRSDSLNLLRFPLAVVVLTIHVFSVRETVVVHGHEYSFDVFPVFEIIDYAINGFLRGQSVPVYFFISGYVFFLGVTLTKDVYKKKLRNRIKTLLVPFLIWNVIALLRSLFMHYCVHPFLSIPISWEPHYTLSALLNTFWDSRYSVFPMTYTPTNAVFPQNCPLWFIRDLMIAVLCTPVISYVLKHTRHYFVLVLGVLWFVLAYWDLGHINQLLTAFFFFSWGAYMSINNKDMLEEFGKRSKLFSILYVSFALLYIVAEFYSPEWCDTIKRLNVIFGLFFFYNLAAWLLRHRICRPNAFLASASFFIYVSHSLVFGSIKTSLLLLLNPSSSIGLILIHIATIALTLAILLGAFWLLRRYAPALLKVIAGRK